MYTQESGAGRSRFVEALQRTVAASALGTLVIATPAAAHNIGPVAEGTGAVAATASIDPATVATGKLPDSDAARDPVSTQFQLAGCKIGFSSYSQFSCN